ncbi:MAG: hypothetical protein JW760_06930, partial [Spirochaetales bacterium]|nr:hypothetical protein [Spirochaetales bacterium]
MPEKKKKYLFVAFSFLLIVSCAHLDSPEGKVMEDDSAAVLPGEETGENNALQDAIPQEQPADVPPPLPPEPFSKKEIDARIVNLVYPGTVPVLREGQLLAVYVDLDGNGYTDACVLCVETDFPERADYRTLSDEARLYQEVLEPFSCSIQFFLQKNGKLYRSGIAPLGRKLVLESFRVLHLGEKEDLPKGASGVFKTRSGTEEEWVLFLPRGISRFTIHESLSIIPVVQDIDSDGVVDILVHQQGFEEGSGHETFLVWYKWSGTAFVEHKSTNIVRNLNAFLQGAAEILKRG